MDECPHCEYNKKRAHNWRVEAYRLAGHPLPEREQDEPVAWLGFNDRGECREVFTNDMRKMMPNYSIEGMTPVYITPQPKQEQGEPDLIECGNCHEGLADMEHVCKKCLGAGWVHNPKQEQGEPVAYVDKEMDSVLRRAIIRSGKVITPQQRTWVGLTYEDMVSLQKDLHDSNGEIVLPTTFAKAVEAKLKEKNT
jgi:hypothetical protein